MPHSSIASGCVPGALRAVLYKFRQIDMVCTLVQAIQVRTSKATPTTHSDSLLHTICYLSVIYFMAWSEGAPYIFDAKTGGIIIVPPVVKLCHAKVVVRRQHPRKKTVNGIRSCRTASYAFMCVFSREDFF